MARVKIAGRRSTAPRAAKPSSRLGLGQIPEWIGPPPGTYDPGLKAEYETSGRGLLDLEHDTGQERHRANVDTAQKEREYKRARGRGLQDVARQSSYARQESAYQGQQLGINFRRDLENLGQAKQRGEEDYNKTLGELQGKYQTTAVQQSQHAIEQGTGERGTEVASAAVRGANQGFEKSGIDQAHQRNEQDLAQREARDREDYAGSLGHLGAVLAHTIQGYQTTGQQLRQDTHTNLNNLSRAALRAEIDRNQKLSRAKRENAFYGTNLAEQAYFQAHEKDPSIVFPGAGGSHGAGGGAGGGHPGASAIGSGGVAAAPAAGGFTPHVNAAVPIRPIGSGRAVTSRPTGRRPYLRY